MIRSHSESATICTCGCMSRHYMTDDEAAELADWFREATSRSSTVIEEPYPHFAISAAIRAQDRFYGHGDGAVTYAEHVRQEQNRDAEADLEIAVCQDCGSQVQVQVPYLPDGRFRCEGCL